MLAGNNLRGVLIQEKITISNPQKTLTKLLYTKMTNTTLDFTQDVLSTKSKTKVSRKNPFDT